MKKALFVMAVAVTSFNALAQDDQPAQDAQPVVAELADSGNLLAATTGGLTSLTHSACQPLKGDKVSILDYQQNTMGVYGATTAHVRVMDGQCAGQEGWLGTAHLAKAS